MEPPTLSTKGEKRWPQGKSRRGALGDGGRTRTFGPGQACPPWKGDEALAPLPGGGSALLNTRLRGRRPCPRNGHGEPRAHPAPHMHIFALVVKPILGSTEPVRSPEPERARGAGRGGGADLADGPTWDDHDLFHGSRAGRSVRAMTPRAYLSDQARRMPPGSRPQGRRVSVVTEVVVNGLEVSPCLRTNWLVEYGTNPVLP
jgi:hypothetical protein